MIADNLTLAAMAKLQHDKDFVRVLGYLSACRDEQVAYCLRERDEVLLRRAQGAANELGELIALCSNARNVLEQRQSEAQMMPAGESYM